MTCSLAACIARSCHKCGLGIFCGSLRACSHLNTIVVTGDANLRLRRAICAHVSALMLIAWKQTSTCVMTLYAETRAGPPVPVNFFFMCSDAHLYRHSELQHWLNAPETQASCCDAGITYKMLTPKVHHPRSIWVETSYCRQSVNLRCALCATW